MGTPLAKVWRIDADQIMPRLWQGSVPPHGDALKQSGFDVVVLAAQEHQPPAHFFKKVKVIYAPLDDTRNPTMEQMRTALRTGRAVARAVRAGKTVLTTCQMGWNRSGLINALAVRDLRKCSGKDAVLAIQTARRGALFNTTFVFMLERLGTPAA